MACPEAVLHALVVLALLWGWPLVGAHLMLGWYGLLRPIEHLAARRELLTLPADLFAEDGAAFLHIPFPKTRRQGPRHQTARVEHRPTIQFLTAVVGAWPTTGRHTYSVIGETINRKN